MPSTWMVKKHDLAASIVSHLLCSVLSRSAAHLHTMIGEHHMSYIHSRGFTHLSVMQVKGILAALGG